MKTASASDGPPGCSIPDVLAFGTLFEKADSGKNAAHLELASKIMESCYEMYHQQPMCLAPEAVSFSKMSVRENQHRLRPEAVNSLFYLYHVTKDPRYREYGWNISRPWRITRRRPMATEQ